MKFTKNMAKVAVALCAAGTLFLTGCPKTEDEYGILKVSGNNATIDYTNDSDVVYARAFKTTATKHLSADILLEIDTSATSTPSSTLNYTAGYIFDLAGSGTESDPYSFGLIGLRYADSAIKYYVSYFTNVLSDDVSSDNGNFVTTENTAVEYDLTGGLKTLDSAYYTVDSDAKTVSVYIDVDAYDDTVKVTADNYGDDEVEADSYKISFRKDADATASSDAITMNLSNLNNSDIYYKSTTKLSGDAKTAQALEEFKVDQAKLGYYAMVKKDTTLKCTMTMSNTVKSAVAEGEAIEWNEVITNVR